MADIFISYAKADREIALILSTFFEAEGWTVWWDKSLSAGDTYRDEIMKQLAAARAVITIWTEHSVRSDWVRAEAGRAKADGKLIPVKGPDATYADIPLPFGEMHTENITDLNLIRAAVVAQLAKPAIAPSALSLATRRARYQFLTWFGIIGGAVTLFSNLHGLVTMADWARRLVLHWHEWTLAFWGFLFGWIGIRLPAILAPLLSFLMFGLVLTLGARFRATEKDRIEYAIEDSIVSEANKQFSFRGFIPYLVPGAIAAEVAPSVHLLQWIGLQLPAATETTLNFIAVLIVLCIITDFVIKVIERSMRSHASAETKVEATKNGDTRGVSLRIKLFVLRIFTVFVVASWFALVKDLIRVFPLSERWDVLYFGVAVFVSLYSIIIWDRRAASTAFITMAFLIFVIIFLVPVFEITATKAFETRIIGAAILTGGMLFLITVAAAPLAAPLRLLNSRLLSTLLGVCLLVVLGVLSNFTPQLREWLP